jgi:thymidylate kinase
VAIVGADGSGKTTVAHELLEDSVVPLRYVYMGPAIGSANYTLPTTRLLNYLRRRAVKGLIEDEDSMPPRELMTGEMRMRLPVRGRIFKILGLINRIAEEWYRQLIVVLFRMRGYSIICDRHFLFEYCPDSSLHERGAERLSVRIHRWLLSRWYPQPHLVIHLYAPATVLHSRTPEWTLEYLERQQRRIRDQGRCTGRFVEIDAGQPLPAVTAEVEQLVEKLQSGRWTSEKSIA